MKLFLEDFIYFTGIFYKIWQNLWISIFLLYTSYQKIIILQNFDCSNFKEKDYENYQSL